MSVKKILIALLAVFICAGVVEAQSLFQNEYYLKSLEYNKMAAESYADGKYEEAYEYALEAEKYARLSDEYIATMKMMYQAKSRLRAAMARIEYADRINLIGQDGALYQEARDTYDSAKNLFDLESFPDSIEESEKVLELLKDIKPFIPVIPPPVVQLLPKFYTVRLIPERRDCFWRIAAYEFVYADGTKWRVLYDENKNVIVNPDNPDLIHPGQVFEIPSIKGEKREDMYDPEVDYPSINDVE